MCANAAGRLRRLAGSGVDVDVEISDASNCMDGVDCGGPCDNACPSCDDGVQNQGEESVDCGGPNCGKLPRTASRNCVCAADYVLKGNPHVGNQYLADGETFAGCRPADSCLLPEHGDGGCNGDPNAGCDRDRRDPDPPRTASRNCYCAANYVSKANPAVGNQYLADGETFAGCQPIG